MKRFIRKIQKMYMQNLANSANIPEFDDSKIQAIRAIFSGKVQGVGFRYETMLIAERLELVGFVRNLADGTVEMLAQGEKEKLDYLIEYLSNIKRAPLDNVDIEKLAVDKSLSKFEVKY